MQIDWDSADKLFKVVTGIAAVVLSGVGVLIKQQLSEIRLSQAENKSAITSEFAAKHAENTQAIAVHTAKDEQHFEYLERAQARTDTKLDRIDTKIDQLATQYRP